MEGKLDAETLKVYGGLTVAFDKLTSEAAALGEHCKRVREHNVALKKLNKSFNEVQSRLERVAAIRPGFSQVNL